MTDPGSGAPLDATRLPTADAMAEVWVSAVRGTSFVAMDERELRDFLRRAAAELIGAVRGTQAGTAAAAAVGDAMIAAHFTGPESLDRTLSVVGAQLAAAATTAPRVVRLATVLGALSGGYSRALQERTRAEQERISAAAFAARQAAESARWASEARYGAVFADAHIGISVADVNGRIIEANRALSEMLGYSPEEIRRRPVYSFVHPTDDADVWDQVLQLTSGERDHLRIEKAYFRKDGTEIWTDLVLSLVRDLEGAPLYMVAMVEDITDRHHLQTRLRHQAQHDPLTDLPNRALFFAWLTAAVARCAATKRSVGVCYLDLDGFKSVNDTLGHDAGDELLCAIATRLARALRGHLVARMGGDEFVVLIEDATPDEAARVAAKALVTARQPVRVGGRDVMVSASVGVVTYPDDWADPSIGHPDVVAVEVMKAADTTLYWAKNDGRNRYATFDHRRHRAEVARFELSARIRGALDRGEFVVHYQPLVRLHDNVVIGMEALVRWRLADGLLLGPAEFVPLAERTGAIVPLGRHVLREAVRQAAAWHAAGSYAAPFTISVNVSAWQIRDPGLVEDVSAILDQNGWPADRLQLELTETDLMGTKDESLPALRKLAEHGVTIAIDDFGTGYSNLAYLHSLPIKVLKLAGPFVTDPITPHNATILRAVIELAHALELSVTAEGIETDEQAELLRDLGCDTGQGWLFGQAGPPAERLPR